VQLSLHSDYALRVLIYLGTFRDSTATTRQISNAYGISKHHLVRVVQTLGAHGYVEILPGRTGGVRLRIDPAEIRLGDVVRRTELNLDVVECFDAGTNTCPIIHSCGLKRLLMDALDAFVDSLNAYTLADILKPGRRAKLVSSFIQLEQLKTRKAV
jgi:Rrf2 family nitric oxide-sensitive transcriptional repressor